jgi:nanoRNase/pAp phosphatase (c-di-AMP/oligoRNAs hydrolase)
MNSKQIWELITSTKSTVYVTAHFGPDPDAICSMLLIYNILTKLKRKVIAVTQNPLYDNFSAFGLPNLERIIAVDEIDDYEPDSILLMVDAQATDRCFNEDGLLTELPQYAIDHHTYDSKVPLESILLDETSASCTELIYKMLEQNDSELISDPDITKLVQVGIIADTERFLFRTTPETYRIMSTCTALNPVNIETLYKNMIKIDGELVHDSIDFLRNIEIVGNCAYLVIPYSVSMAQYKELKTIFLTILWKYITGVEWVFLAREVRSGAYRVSFRSLENGVNVLEKAIKYGGGGVYSAASCEVLANSPYELGNLLV